MGRGSNHEAPSLANLVAGPEESATRDQKHVAVSHWTMGKVEGEEDDVAQTITCL